MFLAVMILHFTNFSSLIKQKDDSQYLSEHTLALSTVSKYSPPTLFNALQLLGCAQTSFPFARSFSSSSSSSRASSSASSDCQYRMFRAFRAVKRRKILRSASEEMNSEIRP